MGGWNYLSLISPECGFPAKTPSEMGVYVPIHNEMMGKEACAHYVNTFELAFWID